MLQPDKRKKLDQNIREVLANGGTPEDVEKLAADFTAQFSDESVKKKEPSVSTVPVQPLASNGSAGSSDSAKSKSGFPEIQPLKGVVPDFAVTSVPVPTETPKKKKEERGLISKKLDDLSRGSSQLWADVSAIPEFTYDIFAVPQNAIADMFDIPSLHADSDKFKKQVGVRNAIKEYYQDEVAKSRAHAAEVDKQYEQGIYDSFKNGDLKGGFDQLSSSFLESLPASVSMMVGGAYTKAPQLLAASTAVFGSGKNEQLKKENPQMNANARTANAFATGLAEGAFETLSSGSFGAAAKGILQREGAKKGVTILKDGIYDFLVESAKKNPFLTEISTEGLSELATTITQNSVDVATGVKPEDYNVFTGGADSFIAGAFGGGVFGGVIHSIKEVGTYQDKKAVKDNTKQIFELQKDLNNETIPDFIRSQIHEKVDALIKSNQQIVQQTRKSVEKLAPSVRTKLVETIQNMETYENQAREIRLDNTLSKDTQEILLSDLKKKYKEDVKTKQSILEGNYTKVDALPLKEQDKLKREALNQLKSELNPDGDKDITITNEMITKRANKLHDETLAKEDVSKTFDDLNLGEHNDFLAQANEQLAAEEVPANERTYGKIKERAVELYEQSLQNPVEEAVTESDVSLTDKGNINSSEIVIPPPPENYNIVDPVAETTNEPENAPEAPQVENQVIEYTDGKGDPATLNTQDIELNEKGNTLLFTENGNRIGHIQINKPNGDEVSISLSGIFNPSLEKKGLGTIMYKKAADFLKTNYNLDLVSDTDRSKESEALWAKLEREGNAVVIGDKTTGNIKDYYYKFVPNETAQSATETAETINPELENYNGIFSKSESSISDKGKGTKEILKETDNRKIVMITPDEYLKLVRDGLNNKIISNLKKSNADKSVIEKYEQKIKNDVDDNINETSRKNIEEAVKNKSKLDMPFVFFDKNGVMIDQDGRNRATYAKKIGEKLIPVLIENSPINSNETAPSSNTDVDGNVLPGTRVVAETGVSQPENTGEETIQNTPDTPKGTGNTQESGEKETRIKSISDRILRGGNSKEISDAVLTSDVNYEKDNQEQTWNKVADMFKEFNSFEMYRAIQDDVITNPSAVTAAYGQLLEQMPSDIEKELSSIENEEDKAIMKELLWEEYGRVVDEFAARATAFGQANAMVNKVIQKAESVRYNLKRQKDSYKAQNNGVLEPEVQRTFEETDAKLKEFEAKIKLLEQEKADQEAQQAVENVQDSLAREAKKTTKQKSKDLAAKIRSVKIHKPGSFSAGTPGSLAWDLGVETVAKTIETGGSIAEAIQNGLEKIKNTDWYKNLSKEQQKDAESDFNTAFAQDKKGNIKASGKTITTPSGIEFSADLFREYVKQGMNNIDDIAKQIQEDISEEYPDAEIRDIRDGLSGYGKTINPSKDVVTKEIARLKSVGKLLSAKEDVLEGEMPKKSGVQRSKPDLEMRTLRKEISAIMKEKGLDSKNLEERWASALTKIKSSLKNQIETLDQQIQDGEKRKVERTVTELDQEAKDLKAIRDEKKKLLDQIAGKPELSDEQKIKRAERSLEASVAKLEEQIALREFDAKKANTPLNSEKLTELRDKKKELLKQKKEIQIETGAVEKARLEMAKKRVENQIEELKRRIAESDFSKKENKPVKADDELRQLREEKLRLFEVYDSANYKAQLKNRTAMQKGVDILMETVNLMRIASGLDLGLMFLQLGPLTVSRRVTNPVRFAQDMVKVVRSIGSEKFSKKMNAELKANPYYPLAEECKLSLTSVDYKLSINEDQFTGDMTNLFWNGPLALAAEHGPTGEFLNKERTVFGDWLLRRKDGDKLSIIQQWKNSNIYPAVERGLITYANILRMEEFSKGVEMLHLESKNQEDNLPEFKKLAAAVNTLTGRGNLPKEAAGINKFLTTVFFSPRNAVAIVNQVNPFWYGSLQYDKDGGFKMPVRIKGGKIETNLTVANKLAIQNMARYVAITTAFTLLVRAAFGDEAEDLVWDPRSYNAGKIIIKGKNGDKISWDPWAGKYHQVSMFTKLFMEQTIDAHSGKLTSLEDADRGSKNRGELFGEYAGNKLSPAGSFAWNYLTAKTEVIDGSEVKVNRYDGEPIKGSFFPSLAPMYWAGFYELQQQDPSAFTELMGAASIMGINNNIIKKPKGKKSKKSSRSGRSTRISRRD